MAGSICPVCLKPDAGFLICPHCGWHKGESQSDSFHLPPGTVIKPPYHVDCVLGHGGFGMTYLGWDANLAIKVAIKEYLPRDFAVRDSGSARVLPASEQARKHFQAGLNQFLDEARTLAKFQQHLGIVSVLSFFPANGTGYMVMEYVEGETLKNYVQRQGRLTWTQTLDIFMHVMDALRAVHGAGLLHRDIAPDNIYLCSDGRVKLLDFGAAQLNPSHSHNVLPSSTIVLKPGFAPAEQYRDFEEQGPWSDVYSLAASMYFCLSGQAPPEALARSKSDSLKPPSDIGTVIPMKAEQILLRALAIDVAQRPQSMTTLQNQFLTMDSGSLATGIAMQSSTGRSVDDTLSSMRPALFRVAIFQGWRGILITILLLLFLLLMLRPERDEPSKALISQDDSAINEAQPVPADAQAQEVEEQEHQAAEELKQQQAAALKRFEERARQEANTPAQQSNQPDPRHLEHLRSLCAEWGATMECKEFR